MLTFKRQASLLSNNDGCVIACSAEAKPFIKMGEPYFKQKEYFRRNGVVCFSSNYEFYADMSNRVKTSPFALNESYYSRNMSVKLMTPTQDSRDIIDAAVHCLDEIWKNGTGTRKLV